MTDTRDRQTPILRGDVYCSLGCGFRCTKHAFDRATAEAAALVSALGAGWEPSVWENCGWNYRAEKGCASVSPNRIGSSLSGIWTISDYTAFFNTGVKQFLANAEKPEDAVGFAVQDARTAMRRLSDDLAALLDEPAS